MIAAAVAFTVFWGDVGFQGYSLGQTIEEARRAPIVSGEFGPRWLACTNDVAPPRFLLLDPEEKRAGVVLCRPYERVGSSDVAASLAITAERSVEVELRFFEGKIFKIDLVADEVAAGVILDALSRRFGKPSDEESTTTQTRAGVSIPQHVWKWVMQGRTIIAVAPDLTVDRMSVAYTDTAQLIRVNAAISDATKANF